MPEIERAIIAVSEGLELQEVLSHYRAFESLKSELIDQESHSDSTQNADTHTTDMTALAKKDHSDKIASTKTPSTKSLVSGPSETVFIETTIGLPVEFT